MHRRLRGSIPLYDRDLWCFVGLICYQIHVILLRGFVGTWFYRCNRVASMCCVNGGRCGTNIGSYMIGGHPNLPGQSVTRSVHFGLKPTYQNFLIDFFK
jgi:hypothetical protein